MAKERLVKTKMWSDDYFQSLSPEDKLLFVYLITNEHTELCGTYEISLKTIAFETGLSIDRVSKGIHTLSKDKKVFYLQGYVVVVNFSKSQHTESDKIQKGVSNSIARLPLSLQEIYSMDTLCIEYDKLELKLESELKLKKPSTKVTEQAPRKEKSLNIDKILEACCQRLGIDAFASTQIMQRNFGNHLWGLYQKLGHDEFLRRLDNLKEDGFKVKRLNEVDYLYRELKGFIEPKIKSRVGVIS